jgi:putative transposase
MLMPTAPNQRWSLDFLADQMVDGRRLRILAVVDDCTRECLALIADTSIPTEGRTRARRHPRPARPPPGDDRLGQWHRADLERGSRLADERGPALHRTR